MIQHSHLPFSDDVPQRAQETGEAFPRLARALYVAIGEDASFKVGTCEHCVLLEQGRPDRAWDANGDQELDFERDRYFALLAQHGLVLTDRQTYVCP